MTAFPWLVADVGGTNARFALVNGHDSSGYQLSTQRSLRNADYGSLTDVVTAYLDTLSGERPRIACLAVAAPISSDRVRMTNIPWCFSITELRRQLGLEQLEVVNDFAALALAVTALAEANIDTLKPGEPEANGVRAVIGPGTGFGTAAVVHTGRGWQALSGEGGHATLAVRDAEEQAIYALLSRRQQHVCVETLLCGPGLLTLYQTLAEIRQQPSPHQHPEQISSAALQHSDRLSEDTVQLFADLLAGLAGDLALIYGAHGGVYLGGGISPRIRPWLQNPRFSERFCAKAARQDYLQAIPIYLITHPSPALIGAAAYLSNHRGDSPL